MRSLVPALFCIVVLSLLGGCSKCDPWWGAGGQPNACHSDRPAK